jgi:hypothetical protein
MTMTITVLNPRWPDDFAPRLAELPVFEPPARLRQRVLAAAPQASTGPRVARFALAAGLGAVLLWQHDAGAPRTADPLALLEQEVLAARAGAGASPLTALMLERELARVDAALQSAYDRAAGEAELALLWDERQRTLETLLLAYRDADRVVRL